MRIPFSNVVTSIGEARLASRVQLHDAWKIGTPEFKRFNYRAAVREGYKKSDLVYACIREIATSVAEAPFQVITEKNNVTTVIDDHPAMVMMEDPNPVMTPDEWWETLLTLEHIAGDSFVLKDMDKRALWILRPDWMQIIPQKGGHRLYKYGPPGHEEILQENEVIHFPYGTDPENPYSFGQSPLVAIFRNVQTDNSATAFFKAFFDNAAVPSGIIKVKRRLGRQSEANRIRKQWSERYTGEKGWHSPAVLDEDAEYQKVGLTLAELEMDTLRHVTESRICMGFGVPPIIVGANVGLQRSTYSNYREARSTFWEETLAPMYKRHARIIRKHLVSEFPMAHRFKTRFDIQKVSALQSNRMELVKNLTPALKVGGLTINQFLTEIGLNPVAGGDRYVDRAATGRGSGKDAEASDPDEADARSYHQLLLNEIGETMPELDPALGFRNEDEEHEPGAVELALKLQEGGWE